MARISATAAVLMCLAFSICSPALAQSSRNIATDNGCFPWQDFKNGQCVAKPAQNPPPDLPVTTSQPAVAPPAPPPPAPPPPVIAAPQPPAPPPPALASPCPDGNRNLSGQCNCPPNTYFDTPSGRCVADSITRAPQLAIVCNGGTVTNGTCSCPSGFSLRPAPDNAGGTCVRANAENCLGGELTANGKCMCSGQVTMDGETYLLEYTNGKCLPARCPVTALLRDGRCVASPSPQLSAEPEQKPKPAKETKDADDDSEPRHHCEHGMVYTRSGCVPARRRAQDNYESRLRQYYRNYQLPGMGN